MRQPRRRAQDEPRSSEEARAGTPKLRRSVWRRHYEPVTCPILRVLHHANLPASVHRAKQSQLAPVPTGVPGARRKRNSGGDAQATKKRLATPLRTTEPPATASLRTGSCQTKPIEVSSVKCEVSRLQAKLNVWRRQSSTDPADEGQSPPASRLQTSHFKLQTRAGGPRPRVKRRCASASICSVRALIQAAGRRWSRN